MADIEGGDNWLYYLDAMIAFASKIQVYTQRLEQKSFAGNDVILDATLRNLELLGEAATHIPSPVREGDPGIPWDMLMATRERLMRSDDAIDRDVLWTIVDDDVPALLASLQSLREAVA